MDHIKRLKHLDIHYETGKLKTFWTLTIYAAIFQRQIMLLLSVRNIALNLLLLKVQRSSLKKILR